MLEQILTLVTLAVSAFMAWRLAKVKKEQEKQAAGEEVGKVAGDQQAADSVHDSVDDFLKD